MNRDVGLRAQSKETDFMGDKCLREMKVESCRLGTRALIKLFGRVVI